MVDKSDQVCSRIRPLYHPLHPQLLDCRMRSRYVAKGAEKRKALKVGAIGFVVDAPNQVLGRLQRSARVFDRQG